MRKCEHLILQIVKYLSVEILAAELTYIASCVEAL